MMLLRVVTSLLTMLILFMCSEPDDNNDNTTIDESRLWPVAAGNMWQYDVRERDGEEYDWETSIEILRYGSATSFGTFNNWHEVIISEGVGEEFNTGVYHRADEYGIWLGAKENGEIWMDYKFPVTKGDSWVGYWGEVFCEVSSVDTMIQGFGGCIALTIREYNEDGVGEIRDVEYLKPGIGLIKSVSGSGNEIKTIKEYTF